MKKGLIGFISLALTVTVTFNFIHIQIGGSSISLFSVIIQKAFPKGTTTIASLPPQVLPTDTPNSSPRAGGKEQVSEITNKVSEKTIIIGRALAVYKSINIQSDYNEMKKKIELKKIIDDIVFLSENKDEIYQSISNRQMLEEVDLYINMLPELRDAYGKL
jgi:hypothetical protein